MVDPKGFYNGKVDEFVLLTSSFKKLSEEAKKIAEQPSVFDIDANQNLIIQENSLKKEN